MIELKLSLDANELAVLKSRLQLASEEAHDIGDDSDERLFKRLVEDIRRQQAEGVGN